MIKLSLLYRIGAFIIMSMSCVHWNIDYLILGTLWNIIAYLEEMKNKNE